MAVLSFFRGLVKSYRNCLQARKNWCAVAHLSDDQLLDIGLYRAGNHIKTIAKPSEPTASIQEPEGIIGTSERTESLEVAPQSTQLSGAD